MDNLSRDLNSINKRMDIFLWRAVEGNMVLNAIATRVDIDNRLRHHRRDKYRGVSDFITRRDEINPVIVDFVCRYADFMQKAIDYYRIENNVCIDDRMILQDTFGYNEVKRKINPYESNKSRTAWVISNLIEEEISDDRIKSLKNAGHNLKNSRTEMDRYLKVNKNTPQYRFMRSLYNMANLNFENLHFQNVKEHLTNVREARRSYVDRTLTRCEHDMGTLMNMYKNDGAYDTYRTVHAPLYSNGETNRRQNVWNNQQLL